ncbi:MAG: hypothetical protein WCS37_00045 [Chloroflexota bacterium]|nr:CCA tRNA nucleotidyltransferase [Chloroflexota bacterium]
MNLRLPQRKALEIVARSQPREIYLVGGFVRDTLLGRESADIDLGVPGEPPKAMAIARRVANQHRWESLGYRVSPFSLDSVFGVARVVFTPLNEESQEKGFYLDVAVLGGDNIQTDLAQRDFTVNALALPLDKFLAADGTLPLEEVLETPGGKADLKGQIIRPIGEKNLQADPLRMLRGIRLRAQLSSKTSPWEFADGTLDLFKKHCTLINRSAAERVREELTKTWLAGDVAHSLQLLEECDLLMRLIPELKDDTHNSFRKTVNLIERLEGLITPTEFSEKNQGIAHPEKFIKGWSEMLADLEANGRERLGILYWATLLSNTANFCQEALTPTNEAEVAHKIMTRLRFSRETTVRVAAIVQHQAWIEELGQDFDLTSGKDVDKLAAYRFLRDTQPIQFELFVLSLVRYAVANSTNNLRGWEQHLALVDSLLRKYKGNAEERLIGKPRLIEGKQLTGLLNLNPGPLVGQLLRKINEAQAIGQIHTSEEALELANQLLEELKLLETAPSGD